MVDLIKKKDLKINNITNIVFSDMDENQINKILNEISDYMVQDCESIIRKILYCFISDNIKIKFDKSFTQYSKAFKKRSINIIYGNLNNDAKIYKKLKKSYINMLQNMIYYTVDLGLLPIHDTITDDDMNLDNVLDTINLKIKKEEKSSFGLLTYTFGKIKKNNSISDISLEEFSSLEEDVINRMKLNPNIFYDQKLDRIILVKKLFKNKKYKNSIECQQFI